MRDELLIKEIEELHEFFVRWFCGDIPESDESFARLDSALGEGFVMVTPEAAVVDRAPLVASLRDSYGNRGRFSIEIREPTIRIRAGSLFVATYHEWQNDEGEETLRLSTVVFGANPEAPNGLEWLHVHETWM